MTIILIILSLVYFTLLTLAAVRWRMLAREKPCPRPKSRDLLFLSVIIPARNEAAHIKALFAALAQQNFPVSSFEVVLIDDHSEDKTLEMAELIRKQVPFSFTIVDLKEVEADTGTAVKGKKMALQQGIEKAKGSVIVTTDADCVMKEGWLRSIHHYFVDKGAKMLSGPVTFHSTKTVFGELQAIEFAALIGTGAVSLSLGKPNMCNGANLAFDKAVFEAVGGYKDNIHIPSGDDEFLLQKIHKQYPKQAFFNVDPEAVVVTYPAKNLMAFISQRKRWGGKWRIHKSLAVKVLAFFIFLYHLSLMTAIVLTVLGWLNPFIIGTLFLFKCCLEYPFIKKILHHLGKPLYIKHFVVLQSIYSIYVLIFGVLANFGTFDWKGRKY